jgi:hypothetical protein
VLQSIKLPIYCAQFPSQKVTTISILCLFLPTASPMSSVALWSCERFSELSLEIYKLVLKAKVINLANITQSIG